ncbi:uncharacterized protein EDB91DRAFT_1112415 [Suillus paluster]|uniref:uncharacterized protein n=1 Tax=Suillus paluster TaxID=48578 RepID=UPI001B874F27|nr:uncharacterized protein EDB91DRAFT_1112415 [Suillus paluster]KAG1749092.1 hypothetical protein EDB91DRAFT_1112415 [Suillus paluster]
MSFIHRTCVCRNAKDLSHLHPSDSKHPTTSENPSGCVNQGPSGEPTSKVQAVPPDVEETSDPQSADADICNAREAAELVVAKVLDAPSDVEEGPGSQSVDAELQDARETAERMKLLGKHVTSVASANDALAGLTAADDCTYLVLGWMWEPKHFGTVTGHSSLNFCLYEI